MLILNYLLKPAARVPLLTRHHTSLHGALAADSRLSHRRLASSLMTSARCLLRRRRADVRLGGTLMTGHWRRGPVTVRPDAGRASSAGAAAIRSGVSRGGPSEPIRRAIDSRRRRPCIPGTLFYRRCLGGGAGGPFEAPPPPEAPGRRGRRTLLYGGDRALPDTGLARVPLFLWARHRGGVVRCLCSGARPC